MLQKKPLPGRKIEVTFRMPPLDDVVELYLCGDFNGWQVNGVPLRQESDGTWVAKLVLDAGKSYRFRYCDNQGRWHNDWEADAYAPNSFGTEDSVLDLTVAKKAPAKSSSAAKKNPAKKAAAKKRAPRAPKKTSPGRQTKGTR
ncbi:MAG: isoamylase early set domain-containing protein [Spirochaetia bacterium]|jgi:1,4-alpha-glucan branching enzyme